MPSDFPAPTKCLVICPIGQAGTTTRKKSDALLEQVIVPALDGIHEVKRGDQLGAQWITPALIEEIRTCALIVTVLTELNVNVFFEMGVAQAWGKPMVTLAEMGTPLPFDVKDLNTVFYSEPGADGRLTEEEAAECRKTLRSVATAAPGMVIKTPFYQALHMIGSQFSLGAIYSGKKFILEVFDAGVQDVIRAMEIDYELMEEGKPEGLIGLAPVLKEKSQFFDQQSRALHKTVKVADLPPGIDSKCLEVCAKMEHLSVASMRLADRLERKTPLESQDVDLARSSLDTIRKEIAACRELIQQYRLSFSI